jgi:hypothetical protein
MNNVKLPWWKLIATWILFLALHYSYETFPNLLFKVIGEEGETTFFHMKMLFFAYIITSIIEYIIQRKKISSPQNFAYTRIFIAVTYPWLTITVWFTGEAITGGMLPMPWEIIYANLITIFGIYIALRLEEVLADVDYRPAMKGSILVIFLDALLTYIVFSFNVPEYFFATPPEAHPH